MALAIEQVRWGILGTARIAERVAAAIHAAAGAELVAIASRSKRRAAAWGETHRARCHYGSYAELLEDDQLDAIYIPLPPALHHEWTIQAAEHGKHVLCEKPLAMDAEQVEGMVAACAANQVQLMDGTMWVHHPRTRDMATVVHGGQLGQLRRVVSGFSMELNSYLEKKPPTIDPANLVGKDTGMAGAAKGGSMRDHEIRLRRDMGGGALMDLGWYCVRASLWAFREVPQRVFGSARYESDVDINFSGMMWFSGGRVATFDCAFDQTWRKWFEIVGDQGSLVCDDFLSPWKPERPRYWVHDAAATATECVAEVASQEQRMVEEFCRLVQAQTQDPQWPAIGLTNQRVCDALAESARAQRVVTLS